MNEQDCERDTAALGSQSGDGSADASIGNVPASAEGSTCDASDGLGSDSEMPREVSPRRSDMTRRALLVGGVATATLFALGGLTLTGRNPLVRPPGGQDESALGAMCVRCQKCYEACPRNVIVPAHLEDGLAGFRTPRLDFSADHCDFCVEENGGVPLCAAVCPTGALAPDDTAPIENTVLGVAVIDTHDCLAYRNTGCRFCFDACPYEAIEMTEDGKNARPTVIAEKCNGCGACESACVSLESGSIAGGATARAIVVVPGVTAGKEAFR